PSVDLGGQVRIEDDVHPVLQYAWAAPVDAELFAEHAACAVGGDQIVGDDRFLLPGFSILDDGTNTGGVLLEGQKLGTEANVRAQPFRATPKDRLQNMLVAGRGLCGAVGTGIGPGRPAPLNVRIVKVSSPCDAAALLVAGAFGADFRLQAEVTK